MIRDARSLVAGQVAMVGMPSDVNSSFTRGAAAGPQAIRQALHSSSSNLSAEDGFTLADETRWLDLGDIECSDDVAMDFGALEATIHTVLQRGGRPLLLGGDHAITFPALKAYAGHFDNLNILHLDAHPDLYDRLDGNPNSHGSPFARIMECGLASRLVQVGIRTLNDHQREQVRRFGVEVHEMKDWALETKLGLTGPLYLSIDLDCLDPAYAPGVSHHEPGGLATRDVIGLIQSIDVELVGADIVELNPQRDLNDITAMVAAKLVKEVAAVLARRQ